MTGILSFKAFIATKHPILEPFIASINLVDLVVCTGVHRRNMNSTTACYVRYIMATRSKRQPEAVERLNMSRNTNVRSLVVLNSCRAAEAGQCGERSDPQRDDVNLGYGDTISRSATIAEKLQRS